MRGIVIQDHPQGPDGVVEGDRAAFLAEPPRPVQALVTADLSHVALAEAGPRAEKGRDPLLAVIFGPRLQMHIHLEALPKR